MKELFPRNVFFRSISESDLQAVVISKYCLSKYVPALNYLRGVNYFFEFNSLLLQECIGVGIGNPWRSI